MYSRGVWRGYEVRDRIVQGEGWGVMTVRTVCTGEGCGGYDSGRYVQERSVGGMTVIGMYRRGVCGGYDSDQYVEERSVEV
ncbi:unnamed protein product [Staurois parvus]|uniref:Uncharacterized protein n=1 Tax=Staurois parvus TaxID=386267 RepID=A0ABN9CA42_9NEOB|nr:unnamed protein product [Staurois parvus]